MTFDNKRVRMLIAAMLAAIGSVATIFIAACSPQLDEGKIAQVTAAARAAGAAAEAKLTDGKWMQARTQLRQLGANTAATGNFLIVDNCNVKPEGFSQLQAVKDFPSSAFTELTAGCTDKVHAMKVERDKAKNRNVLAERQRVAAAKARAERMAAAKKAAGKQHVAQANVRR